MIAVEEVPREETRHYGIVQPEGRADDVFRVVNLVEKPAPQGRAQQPGHRRPLHFLARDFRHDPPRAARPARRDPAHRRHPVHVRGGPPGGRGEAARPGEKRYDIGNFPSYFESFVEFALADPVYGEEFRRVLERLLAKSRRNGLTDKRLVLPAAVAALLLAARMCHAGILWEGDSYPLAAAGQMLHGKALYRDIWFDKPPLLAAVLRCCAARAPGGRCAWQMRSTPCCAAGCATASRAICGRGGKACGRRGCWDSS